MSVNSISISVVEELNSAKMFGGKGNVTCDGVLAHGKEEL